MTSIYMRAWGVAIKQQSMASNVNCVCRTVGSGEYTEQHLCSVIEPEPRNCSMEFENICCMCFQHSWKLYPLHLLLLCTWHMFRFQSENIRDLHLLSAWVVALRSAWILLLSL